MNSKRKDFLESINVLIDIKSSLEAAGEPKVIGKQKTVEEQLEDLRPYLEEDIEL